MKTGIAVRAVAVLGCYLSGGAIQPGPQDRARALLDEAIVAAGGAENLRRHAAFAWHGAATVSVPGRLLRIEGDWRIEAPDRAIVETFEVEKGPASTRALVIDGDRGWSRIAGKEQPLPAAVLANERDQFYLYYLVRLVPLLDSRFRLTPLDPDAEGRAGLRVQQTGRRDADLYFDRSRRLAGLVTTVTDPASGRDVVEELGFDGTVEADGVRWPQRIRIAQDGRPFFDLVVSGFRTLAKLELPAPWRRRPFHGGPAAM